MKELIKTINSLEVAKMVDKQHKEVLRDIRRIIDQLAERKIALSELFIESTYEDTTGRELPCYLLTKKGCELFATRMTGSRGTQFAIEYIERFNEMEQQLIVQQLPMSNTELLLETALKHERDLVEVNGRLEKLETETIINSSQRRKLQGMVQSTVIKALGGKQSTAYKNQSINKSAFSNCYNQVKKVFDVASYADIPKVRFEEALQLIPKWQPSLELQARIATANGSGRLFEFTGGTYE